MATLPLIQVWSDQDLISESTWQVSHISSWERYRWQSVDLTITNLLQHETPTTNEDLRLILVEEGTSTPLEPGSSGSNEAYDFLLQTLLVPITQGQTRLIKLIVPRSTGYIARSDIIPLRLHDCPRVEVVRSFTQPLQVYNESATPAVVFDKKEISFSGIFKESAAGLLVFSDPNSDLQVISSELEQELGNRLSFPWLIHETPRERTLILVEANSSHPQDGLGLYIAAKALGIKLVVLDEAHHWLESHEGDNFREAFMPITLTNPPKPELTDHILTAVKSYGKPIDGIMTCADTYWPFVAEAAIALGLPAASPEAFQIATNKYKTSVFAGHQAHHASSPEEAALIAQRDDLSYPLIAKPCGGLSSEAVYRVDSPDALQKAISAIFSSRHDHELVIEPYCDGPEVEVNLVLQDGQLLFFEVCDDLPKSADVNGPKVGSLSTFHELCSVYPSKLPKPEIELLRDTFVDILLSLGLRSGVFHLEGRVENSTVEYKEQVNGNMELTASNMRNGQVKVPKAWLIEINPRPLGMTGSQIIEHTYGIDYWGLALLLTVNDTTRSRALALPFKNGPQYTSAMVFIPADFPLSCQGVFDSDDICKELFSRRTDLEAFVSRCGCLVKRGQKVPHPSEGRNTFVAYFNVFSRRGRQEAMDIARQVREEVRYQFNVFAPMVPFLDPLFDVLVLDDPFFGQAQGPESIQQWAEIYLVHVQERLVNRSGSTLVFGGYSLGGLIAYEMASLWHSRHDQYPALLLLLDAAMYVSYAGNDNELEYGLTLFGQDQKQMVHDHYSKISPLNKREPSTIKPYLGSCFCLLTPESYDKGAAAWWSKRCPSLQVDSIDCSHHDLIGKSSIGEVGRRVNERCTEALKSWSG